MPVRGKGAPLPRRRPHPYLVGRDSCSICSKVLLPAGSWPQFELKSLTLSVEAHRLADVKSGSNALSKKSLLRGREKGGQGAM